MAKRLVQPSIDVEAVVAHAFRATTADSFMGLRLGMTASEVARVIGPKGTWQKADPVWEHTQRCSHPSRLLLLERKCEPSIGEVLPAQSLLDEELLRGGFPTEEFLGDIERCADNGR